MTTLLQRAIAAIEGLSAEDQDAIAARLLAELDDENAWERRFRSTPDDLWDRMAAEVRSASAHGQIQPLDAAFPPKGSTP